MEKSKMNKSLFIFLFGILIFLTLYQNISKHSSEIKTNYLYTELQHSHMENGKYKKNRHFMDGERIREAIKWFGI